VAASPTHLEDARTEGHPLDVLGKAGDRRGGIPTPRFGHPAMVDAQAFGFDDP